MPPRPHPRPPRTALKLALSLALGLLLSITSAWLPIFAGNIHLNPTATHGFNSQLATRWWTTSSVWATQCEAFPSTREDLPPPLINLPDTLPPAWAITIDSRRTQTISYGLPFRCLRGVHIIDKGPPLWNGKSYRGWLVTPIGKKSYTLPIDPHYPGLLANTLLYATPFFTLSHLLPTIRRHLRKKRTACPNCGYSLAGLPTNPTCPECGATNADQRRAPSPECLDSEL